MITADDRIYIHFNTNDVNVYQVKENSIILLKNVQLFFNETLVNDELLKKIDNFLNNLEKMVGVVSNKRIRLYATGIFQELRKNKCN